MVKNKFSSKVRAGREIVSSEGLLSFAIVSLQYIKKRKSKNNLIRIDTGAPYNDIISADPNMPANKKWQGLIKNSYTVNWLMPPPGKGSGGHMTLFRFISALEEAGHICRIYFHKPGPTSTVEQVINAMGDDFPKLEANMEWLWPGKEMEQADAIFATSWQTAYTVYASKIKAKKFYFVQDFEPYFYPVGGFHTLAENTYKLGLRGITAGGWLAQELSSKFGMTTDYFEFGSDSGIYKFNRFKQRKEIVFYARPTTERRAFELGILTLSLFNAMHPDYKINFVGWDVSDFKIPFPYENLGILSPAQLNKVYNRCSASLVMSMTNMSLLPLELLSSGCIPVVTDGPNNRLVSNNKYIAYSEPVPIRMAETLSSIITKKGLLEYSALASRSVESNSWDVSRNKFVKIVEKSIKSSGDK